MMNTPVTSVAACSVGTSFSCAAVEQQRAEPGVVEQQLDGDEPADEVAQLHAERGDRHDHGVAQHVTTDELAGRQALQAGGADVRALHRGDHAGAHHPRDVPDGHDQQAGDRQDQPVQAVLRRGPTAAASRAAR